MNFDTVGTELWQQFVKEGQRRAHVDLSETEESYIVFMLQRFIRKTELTGITFALEYLEGHARGRTVKYNALSETADAGLLLAGLFPERAKRKNVPSSYFIRMSQMCFLDLATLCEEMKHLPDAKQYREFAFGAERLAYVLYCTRQRNTTVQEILHLPGNDILH